MAISESLLGLVHLKDVGHACMGLIDRLQNYRDRQVRAAAFGVSFLTFCEANKLNPNTVLQVSRRIMDDTPNHTPELRALRAYIENQVT